MFKTPPRGMDLLLILAGSVLLGLGQAVELIAQAPGVPIVNAGAEDAKAISAKIEALKQTKTFLTIDEARKQLERTACDIPFSQPTKSVRLTGRDVWETARIAYVRIGWYCLCHHCNDRHVNLGGGFYVTKDGVAATAAHVLSVDHLKEGLLVAVNDAGVVMPVTEVLAVNRAADVALVRVDTTETTVPLSLTTDVYPGDSVWCYSHPMQHGAYFSRGVINRFAKTVSDVGTQCRIHVSSVWAPGSSGSGILDQFGNAVGIVSGIEVLSDPATKQPLLRIHQAARVADLRALAKPAAAASE